jgi:hypothetical protein
VVHVVAPDLRQALVAVVVQHLVKRKPIVKDNLKKQTLVLEHHKDKPTAQKWNRLKP